jgi:hypothetical protein
MFDVILKLFLYCSWCLDIAGTLWKLFFAKRENDKKTTTIEAVVS